MDKKPENQEYKGKRVLTTLRPNVYKVMRIQMDRLGIQADSTYIAMAVKKLNDSLEINK